MGQAVRSKMAAGKGRKKKNNGSRLSDKLPVMRGAELHNRQANHSTKRKGTPALYKEFFFSSGPRVVRSLAVFFFFSVLGLSGPWLFFFFFSVLGLSGPWLFFFFFFPPVLGLSGPWLFFFFGSAEIMGQTQGKRHWGSLGTMVAGRNEARDTHSLKTKWKIEAQTESLWTQL